MSEIFDIFRLCLILWLVRHFLLSTWVEIYGWAFFLCNTQCVCIHEINRTEYFTYNKANYWKKMEFFPKSHVIFRVGCFEQFDYSTIIIWANVYLMSINGWDKAVNWDKFLLQNIARPHFLPTIQKNGSWLFVCLYQIVSYGSASQKCMSCLCFRSHLWWFLIRIHSTGKLKVYSRLFRGSWPKIKIRTKNTV